jgi:putative transposase
LSNETIRRWCNAFGACYAAKLKRRRPKLGDKWSLDEVFLKINGMQHYLWRAADQQGAVIDVLVQPKRDRFAAMRFFRKLLQTSQCGPRVIITD